MSSPAESSRFDHPQCAVDRRVSAGGNAALNGILASLPEAEFGRLREHASKVHLSTGQVLYEPGADVTQVYFPVTAIVSLLHLSETGESVEVAAVGNEGMVGLSTLLGGSGTGRAVVQTGGAAFQLPRRAVEAEIERSAVLLRTVFNYALAVLGQMAQTAVCNRHHSIHQQLCRWLLFRLDRAGGSALFVTHETIAGLLGVRREAVSTEASKLRDQDAIRCVRGRIIVLDRAKLESGSCECYRNVKKHHDRQSPFRHHDHGSFGRSGAMIQ